MATRSAPICARRDESPINCPDDARCGSRRQHRIKKACQNEPNYGLAFFLKLMQRNLTFVAFIVIVVSITCAVWFLSAHSARGINKLAGLCRNNLRLIDAAKQQWALERQKTTNDPPPIWDDLREYIGRGPNNSIVPECPCGGTYMLGRLDQAVKCSLTPAEHTYKRVAPVSLRSGRNRTTGDVGVSR